jgi:hypothetical protein
MVLRKRDVQPGVADLVLVGDLDDLPSAYVHGRVVDARSNALADVAVHAFSNHIGDSARTNASGSFRIGPLRRGEVELWVEPAQRPRIVFKSTNVAAREDRDLGDLTVPDLRTRAAHVAARRRHGAARPGELSPPRRRPALEVRRRLRPMAERPRSTPGKYELVAHAANALEAHTEIEVLAGETRRRSSTRCARLPSGPRRPGRRRRRTACASSTCARPTNTARPVLDRAWHDKSSHVSPRFAFPFGRIHLEAEADGGRRAAIDFEHRPGLDVEDAIRLELVAGR